MRARFSTACVAALLALLLARGARADATRVALASSSDAALDARIAAELSSLGFVVTHVGSGEPTVELSAIARANAAVAAVRVDHDDAIEVWVESRHPPDPPIHELVRLDPHRDRNVAAVSALEALRAHLLTVRPAPAAPPAAAAAAAAAAPAPVIELPRAPPWLWIHVAMAGDASPGGLPLAVSLFGGLRIEPRSWMAISVFGAVSPLGAHVEAPEGIATVSRVLVGGAADLQTRVGATTLGLGLGGTLALQSVRGQSASAGYDVRDASLVTAGPMLRSCIAVPIASTLRVRAELAGGATLPRASISFAGREVASWGRPFALLTLGIEWGPLK